MSEIDNNVTKQEIEGRCVDCISWQKLKVDLLSANSVPPLGFRSYRHKNPELQIGICVVFSNPVVINDNMNIDYYLDRERTVIHETRAWWKIKKTKIVTMSLSNMNTLLPEWIVKPAISYGVVTQPDFYCALFKSNKDAENNKTEATG